MAILARVDAVLLGLVSVPLLYTANHRQTFNKLALFAVVAVAVASVGLYASGCNVMAILHTTQSVLSKPAKVEPQQGLVMKLAASQAFTACAAFFPLLTLLLIGVGGFCWLRQRLWKLVLIFAAGLLPVLLVYRTGIYASPLYYTIPFFGMAALFAVQEFPAPAETQSSC